MTTGRFGAVAAALALLVLTACGGDETPDSTPDSTTDVPRALSPEAYAMLRAEIGPQPEDEAWQSIEWYPSYREGLEVAAAEQKPVLLWVMNGHPLGCT